MTPVDTESRTGGHLTLVTALTLAQRTRTIILTGHLATPAG
ncbi:hypothetical protein [Symbioplanes lichenis]|nr:hypothetical protein [Actinoplanes lichenis]